MTDVLTQRQRSECMRAVNCRDTGPEMLVRRMVHAMGYRYALYSKYLPGKPDLVFVSRRKIIFVHGCFWHNHRCRHGRVSPTTNADYWRSKRERNAQRDRQQIAALRKDGWRILVLWECWTQNPTFLLNKLTAFLEAPPPHAPL